MDIEQQWNQALRETEVDPLSNVWPGFFIGGLLAALIAGGLAMGLGMAFHLAVITGFGASALGCLAVLFERNNKTKRRQSFVELLVAKLRNGMEITELGAVLSALGDLGATASSALPLIDAIQNANNQSDDVRRLCKEARDRITQQ